MKAAETMQVETHVFFNSALGGNEWLFDLMGRGRSATDFRRRENTMPLYLQ